jgi:hypothetical protein
MANVDAMIAITMVQRESLRGEPPSRAAAAAEIRRHAATMRTSATKGRADYDAMLTLLTTPNAAGRSEEQLRLRGLRAFSSYPASFAVEETAASQLEQISGTLEAKDSFEDVVTRIDRLVEDLAATDNQRNQLMLERTKQLQ